MATNKLPELGFRVSRGVLSTIYPPIPQAYKWAAKYPATPDRPLLDMSQGVPGIPPQLSLQKALGEAASSRSSFGYCPAEGELSLRQTLAEDIKSVYGNTSEVTAQDVALTAGCNMAFVAVVMSLADANDEVILPAPWYFNHQMTLTLLGIKPVILETSPETGFIPSLDRCKALITNKTKLIALVTPNNPTGAVYPPSLLRNFVKLAQEHDIALVVDETYRDFITSGSPHSIFSLLDWRKNFIHLYSFSKSYCIPGHRLGAVVASPAFIESLKIVLDTLQICAPRPPQQALAQLLPSLRPSIKETATAIEQRHILFRRKLPEKWKIGAQGGYYAFVKHPFVNVKAVEVSKRLAEEVGVVSLPSAFFLDDNVSHEVEERDRWIRFSVANVDDEKVKKVCERLKECEGQFGWETV